MSEVKNVTITVPVGLNGWQQEGSVVINGMKVEFPVGVETEVPETAAALLKELIEAAEKRAENVPANNDYRGSLVVPEGHILHLEKGAKIKDENGLLPSSPEDVVILPETVLEYLGIGDQRGFLLNTRPADEIKHGKTYVVTYNGTDYKCEAVDMGVALDGVANGTLLLGNLQLANLNGGNAYAPFIVLFDNNVDIAPYARCLNIDGATSVALSIVEKAEATGGGAGAGGSGVVFINGTIDLNGGGNETQLWLIPDKGYDECTALIAAGKYLVFMLDGGTMLADKMWFPLTSIGERSVIFSAPADQGSAVVAIHPESEEPRCTLTINMFAG